MSASGILVAKLRFSGGRYDERALDEAALLEVLRFQKIYALTAETIWRRQNPNSKRLPAGFGERTALCLRALETGSTVAPLVTIREPSLFGGAASDSPVEAAAVIHHAFDAVSNGRPPPAECPRDLLADYAHFGERLSDNETLEIILPNDIGTRVSPQVRAQLHSFLDKPYEDDVDVTGRVLRVDVRRREFEIWIDGKRRLRASFAHKHESAVIAALQNHAFTPFRVRGRGEFSPDGNLLKIVRISEFDATTGGELAFDTGSPGIISAVRKIFEDIPESEWENTPTDLAERHDHYIYGADDE